MFASIHRDQKENFFLKAPSGYRPALCLLRPTHDHWVHTGRVAFLGQVQTIILRCPQCSYHIILKPLARQSFIRFYAHAQPSFAIFFDNIDLRLQFQLDFTDIQNLCHCIFANVYQNCQIFSKYVTIAGWFPGPGWRVDRSLPWIQLHLLGGTRLLVRGNCQ